MNLSKQKKIGEKAAKAAKRQKTLCRRIYPANRAAKPVKPGERVLFNYSLPFAGDSFELLNKEIYRYIWVYRKRRQTENAERWSK